MIDISDKSKKTEKKIKPGYNKDKKGIQYTEQFNMAGKSPEEMSFYLLSGESDDPEIES